MLTEGDKFVVELSGWVSPGGLQNFWHLKDHLEKFHQLQIDGKKDQWQKILNDNTWPYTGPEGYQEKWYNKGNMIGILRNHKIYGSGNGLNDECMTVKGKPHNRVFAIIQNEEPKDTIHCETAYKWETDKDLLIELSDKKYPKTITANRTGELWVVINDVDYARWDNTGMFFLRVTKDS